MKKIVTVIMAIIFSVSIIISATSYTLKNIMEEQISDTLSSEQFIKQILQNKIDVALLTYNIANEENVESIRNLVFEVINDNTIIETAINDYSKVLFNDLESGNSSDVSEINESFDRSLDGMSEKINNVSGNNYGEFIIEYIKDNVNLQDIYNEQLAEIRNMLSPSKLILLSLINIFSSPFVYISSGIISLISMLVIIIYNKKSILKPLGIPSLISGIFLIGIAYFMRYAIYHFMMSRQIVLFIDLPDTLIYPAIILFIIFIISLVFTLLRDRNIKKI